MEPISNDFDIKAIRGALHLSVEALARRLEVSEKTVRPGFGVVQIYRKVLRDREQAAREAGG